MRPRPSPSAATLSNQTSADEFACGGLLAEQLEQSPSSRLGVYYLTLGWYLLAALRSLAYLTPAHPFRRKGWEAPTRPGT